MKFSKEICVVCNYQLTVFSLAKKNVTSAQRALLKYEATKNASNNPEEISLHCDTCEFTTQLKTDLISHIESHKNVTYKCSSCQCNFDSYNELYHHRQTTHTEEDFKKWICHQCNRSFSGGGSLTNHIAIYHASPPIDLECPVNDCDKKFKTKKQLSQHKKIHNEEKQICPECGIIVVNKHNLTKHIKRIHLKIYNFFCDFCEYKGFFKFNMEQHVSGNYKKKAQF